MATSKWSTYTATAATVLSTEANSLANGSITAAGSEIDNSTNGDMRADFELILAAQGVARSGGATVPLYIVTALDGTNYTDVNASVSEPVGSFTLDAATTARRAIVRGVPLSPAKHKPVLGNLTGQAFAASGTSVRVRLYNVTTN